MAIFGTGDNNTPSAVDVLEEARKHVPLQILVDLVEAHYRSRRNRLFMSAVGILATAVMGSAATIYMMYTNYEQEANARTREEIETREKEVKETDRQEARQRTATRIDFIRSLQSFAESQPLPVGRQLFMSLSAGQRRQFRIMTGSDARVARYEIRVDGATDDIEAVMYLYKRGSSTVDPIESNNRRGELRDAITFNAEDDSEYYLEVEELVGTPGGVRLTVNEIVGSGDTTTRNELDE